jgi:outer membrane protein assembly factor BamD (BamD/ComL family)
MKSLTSLLVGALVITISLLGCSKKGSVDTSELQSSFKSAEPATRSDVDKAVAAIKDGNYSDAIAQLQRVTKKAQLTPEQQQAIKDTITAIQKHMAEIANKAAGEARKTAEDLKKSLPVK